MFPVVSNEPRLSRAWFDGPAARAWLAEEDRLLADVLARLTGYRAISLGPGPTPQGAKAAATLRHWRGDLVPADGVDFIYDGQDLPLASRSVDALILRHGLELAAEPHRLIRECDRVLSARGQLVTVVFNPLAPAALLQSLSGAGALRPASRAPRMARLVDLLRMVDFQATDCWRYGPGFPLFSRAWQGHNGRGWLAPIAWCAGGYVLLARRRALRRVPPGGRPARARLRARGLAAGCRSG